MADTRQIWLKELLQIVTPVLNALEREELRASLPLSFHAERAEFAPLEAFGRSMLGLSAWLDADPEELADGERALLLSYRHKAGRCIAVAVDPDSPDYMKFDAGGQPLVDTAFLAHAIVRCPGLLDELDSKERDHLAEAFRASRSIPAYNSNWIFFSAMVEGGLYVMGEQWDVMRVLYAMRMFETWYKGDGIYGDGPDFHWDYYNSFVIQPMYVDLVDLFSRENEEIAGLKPAVLTRAARYAAELERMIGPEGSYPIIGRSICYRFGAFQLLSQMALEHRLPAQLSPASVRCGLTAVIRRVTQTSPIYDEQGWLLPGVIGYQPELAEPYINIGSLYLCTAVFLPLGLSPRDPFWSDPDEDWTAKKAWGGGHIGIDHALF